MWEIWYCPNNSSDPNDAMRLNTQTYHNKETAKYYARRYADHPTFTDSTLYVYDTTNGRLHNVNN